MAKRNIGATLTLKAGNFFTNMKSASGQVQGLKKQFSSSTGSVKSFGSSVTSAGDAVSSLVKKAVNIAAVAAGFRAINNAARDVVQTGADFEQQMAKVQAISGASGEDFNALTKKAMEMGATTKFSAQESAQAMEYMAMAGWKTEQMINGIPGIMNLAAASGEDLASVSDIVTDSLTAFGLKASDSARFADILAKAASSSNTNVAMLGESFKYAAPAAGALGYDVRDVTTALGMMANAGIKSTQAGTAMRAWMTRMAKPTKQVYDAMEDLNLSFTNADGSMKPLSALIPELQQKFSKLTEKERGQYAAMLAGQEAMSGFLAVVNAAPGDFEKLSNEIYNSEGAAKSMADTMNDTLSGQMTLFKSQLEGVKISIYQALGSSQFKDVVKGMSKALAAAEPYVKSVAVGIGNNLFGAINSLKDILSTVGGVFEKAFGAVSAALAVNYNAVQNVKTKFEELKTSFTNLISGSNIQGFLDNIADSAVQLATSVLSKLLDALQWAVDNFELVRGAVFGLSAAFIGFKAISASLAVGNIISGVFTTGKVVLDAMRMSMTKFMVQTKGFTVVQKLSAAAQWLWNAALSANPVGIVIIAVAALTAAVIAMYLNWDKIKAKFPEFAKTVEVVIAAVKTYVSVFWTYLKTSFLQIKAVFMGILEQWKLNFILAFNIMKNYVTVVVNEVKIIFWGIVSTVMLIGTFVKQVFTGDFKGAGETLKKIFMNVVETIKQLFLNKFDFIKNQLSAFKDYFKGTWENIKNTVSGVWTAITSGAKEAFNKIAGFINNTLGNFKIDVPEWVPGIGGMAFSIPKIPMLANGGVITRPGDVMVGERGPEVLSLPTGAKVTPLNRYKTENNSSSRTQNTFYITVYADNRSEDEAVNRMAAKIKAVLDTL